MTTITRHRWTQEERAHLNRVVGRSKNKTEAFKKVAAEMGMPWEAVKSTYWNHRKTDGQPEQMSIFRETSDDDLLEFAATIKAEVTRRVKALEELRKIYS